MNSSRRTPTVVRAVCIVLTLFIIVINSESYVDGKNVNIPVGVMRRLRACNSTAELFRRFVVKKHRDVGSTQPSDVPGEDFVFNPDGSLNRDAIQTMDQQEPLVQCQPRIAVVQFPDDPLPDVVLHPRCTELRQCSGCCDEHLECQATSTQTVYKQPSRLKYDPETGDFFFFGFANVSMEEHLSCDCNCKVQPSDCDQEIHWFDSMACQCRCVAGTSVCHESKTWSEQQCDCVCPNVSYCLADEVYDFLTCRCVSRSAILPAQSNQTAAQK